MKPKLLIATRNPGKMRELQAIFADLTFEYLTLDEAGVHDEVAETGDTYAANALLKATAACRATGLLSLGDDSGLEVDALGGRPGLYSARYGERALTWPERRAKLLDELEGAPEEKRTARFRCVIALCTPGKPPATVEGICEGRIAFAPAGSGGFGYDPIFYLPDYGCTMAELDEETKNQISHRGRAAQKAKAVLRNWLEN
jgi:XTP/dITP diphosphohydrolase